MFPGHAEENGVSLSIHPTTQNVVLQTTDVHHIMIRNPLALCYSPHIGGPSKSSQSWERLHVPSPIAHHQLTHCSITFQDGQTAGRVHLV